MLSGLDAQYRRESQLEGTQLRFLAASEFAAAAEAAAAGGGGGAGAGGEQHLGADAAAAAAAEGVRARLAALALAGDEAAAAGAARAAGAPRLEADAVAREIELHSLLPPWPLLSALAPGAAAASAAAGPKPPAAALLGRFAAEGDNVADALSLAGAALRVLGDLGALPAAAAAAAAAGGADKQQQQGQQQQQPGGQWQLRTPASWAGLYGRPYEEVA